MTNAEDSASAEMPQSYSLELEGIGEILLINRTTEDNVETAQLVLRKPGGMREIIDSYEGLHPADIRKFDLDADSYPELIVLLKHPDGVDVIPYVYKTVDGFKRVFPPVDNLDIAPLICREVVLTTNDEIPVLCAKNIVSYHDFGPPYLYSMELYRLNKDNLELFDKSYSEGDHYNILMNRGAIAFHAGNYLEAIDYYQQAVSSSTGDITTKAFIEAIYFLAESRKYSKDFKGALELYQRIVLEFKQNARTDEAQDAIELISSCADNPDELSMFIDASSLVNNNQWEEAMAIIENANTKDSKLQDRFLFMKAEILIAQNQLENAIKVLHEFQTRFPESPLNDEAASILQDIQNGPDEINGL
ncbi:MAG: hypothetical protein Kow0029_07640 [Candidatus Rifleibacteriota bacterium]